jgi:hypothetical protein
MHDTHAIIVQTTTDAEVLNKFLNADAEAFPYGYPFCGRGLSGFTLLAPPKPGMEAQAEEWVNCSLKTKLMPETKKAPN